MAEICLVDGSVVVVSDEDYARIAELKWHITAKGYVGRNCYKNGKQSKVYVHRFITDAPRGVLVDHKDRNKLNNRRSNLRVATKRQNSGNAVRIANKWHSRFKGVTWSKQSQKWTAQLKTTDNGIERNKHLGSFSDELSAAAAYNDAAKQHFGEFAVLNHV